MTPGVRRRKVRQCPPRSRSWEHRCGTKECVHRRRLRRRVKAVGIAGKSSKSNRDADSPRARRSAALCRGCIPAARRLTRQRLQQQENRVPLRGGLHTAAHTDPLQLILRFAQVCPVCIESADRDLSGRRVKTLNGRSIHVDSPEVLRHRRRILRYHHLSRRRSVGGKPPSNPFEKVHCDGALQNPCGRNGS